LLPQQLLLVFSERSRLVLFGSVLSFQVGERIRVILDCDDNTLAFEKNYEFLGKCIQPSFRS